MRTTCCNKHQRAPHGSSEISKPVARWHKPWILFYHFTKHAFNLGHVLRRLMVSAIHAMPYTATIVIERKTSFLKSMPG